MERTPITEELVKARGFICEEVDSRFRKLVCQWNKFQRLTLFYDRWTELWTLQFCSNTEHGLCYMDQIDTIIALWKETSKLNNQVL